MQIETLETDEPNIENPCCQCLGTGKIVCPVCDGSGRMPDTSVIDAECLKCHETGRVVCPECEGRGISYFMRFDHIHSHIAPSFVPRQRRGETGRPHA